MASIIYYPEGIEVLVRSKNRPNRDGLVFLGTFEAEQDNPGISEYHAMRLGGLAADLTLRDYDNEHASVTQAIE